jgi:DNA-binding response OmpR family regulator
VTTRLLVVDDDPRLSHVISTYLKIEGYEVTTADNAVDGLQLTALERFDLIFLDVMMPGMDGIAACRRLRENPATARTPVVIFTALSSQSDIERAREAGATHLITKPFGLDGLGAVVRSLVHAPV